MPAVMRTVMTEKDELPVLRRLDMVERDVRDHAKTFTAFTESLQALQVRLTANEVIIRRWEIGEARAEERSVSLNKRLDEIDKDLMAIKGVGVKLLWIVAGGIVTTFIAFLLRGGLVL